MFIISLPSVRDVAFVRQDRTNPVCCPYVLWVIPNHLFVSRECPLLVLFLLLLVFGGLVKGLEPNVAQGDVRVGVVVRSRLL